MENPLNIPFHVQSAAVGSCVLDVSLEQKKLGWREDDSGWSSVTLTHEALISREEVEKKDCKIWFHNGVGFFLLFLLSYLWSQRKHQLALLGSK